MKIEQKNLGYMEHALTRRMTSVVSGLKQKYASLMVIMIDREKGMMHYCNIGDGMIMAIGKKKNAGDNDAGMWYKQGGSAICFDAFYTDDVGHNHACVTAAKMVYAALL